MNLRRAVAKNYVNFRGWSSKRKYVVIESDDWGSIRMPSLDIYKYLLKKGVGVDKNLFTKYDCLESNDDLELLFDLLSSYKDTKGNHPVITAVSVMANPDFDKIRASGKKEYSYELFTETYKKYPNHSRVIDLWKNEGIDKNLLWPQFHGREHLNARRWIRALNSGNDSENLAFDKKVLLGIQRKESVRNDFNYMAAFEFVDDEHKTEIENITLDGLQIFENIFGFRSKSFAASGSIRGDHLDKILAANDVQFHQLGQQFVPQPDNTLKIVNRFWGDKNSYDQIYWRRNATFEPARSPNVDWVDKCLNDIKIAFRWGKPAVISSHRVNFSGGISTENRDKNLQQLHKLIKRILHFWPDAEFINSQQLGKIMLTSKRNNV